MIIIIGLLIKLHFSHLFVYFFPGDSMFNTLRRYGLYYDSSMSTAQKSWPYTLEYRMPHSCSVKPCPTESHPGKVYLFWIMHPTKKLCALSKKQGPRWHVGHVGHGPPTF